jgi:hypothetical protein
MQRKTWLFQANPRLFDIDSFLQTSPRPFLWLVTRSGNQMRIGDRVFLWRAVGDGNAQESGVIAEAEMVETPAVQPDDAASLLYWRGSATADGDPARPCLRVRLALKRVAAKQEIIQRRHLLDDSVLQNLTILRQAAGTNYFVPADHAARLEALWDSSKRGPESPAAPPAAASKGAALDLALEAVGALIKQVPNGLLVSQSGRQYIAAGWQRDAALDRLILELLKAGLTNFFRLRSSGQPKHPRKVALESEVLAGKASLPTAAYLGFSKGLYDPWVIVLDGRTKATDLRDLVVASRYAELLTEFGIPFEREGGGGHNLFMPADHLSSFLAHLDQPSSASKEPEPTSRRSLSGLTDRQAVLRAIEECDQLGETAFLEKYGFAASKGYHLVYEGLTYPSKAIVGVAFKYQHPSAEALKASEFSGGAATVQRVLERLGFGVEAGSSAPERSQPLGEEAADESSFDPATEGDAEGHTKQTIRARRGQAAFRNSLLSAYGGCCAITGCDVLAVLEAAHIVPYRGQWTNKVSNGLLLRADIHTLFDCARIGIDPASLEVLIHPDITDPVYRALHGRSLRVPTDKARGPSRRALEMRQEKLRLRIPSDD